jgi:fucose permease
MEKRKKLILITLYIAFIALGLPDQLLGVAWPTLRSDFNLDLKSAGIATFIGTFCSAMAGYFSGYIAKKYSVSTILIISVLLTAIGNLGYSLSPCWLFFVFFVIPTGLGAGSVDSALNNYVSLNYSSRHMSWLHAFWGIGSTLGAIIMTLAFVIDLKWRGGYFIVGIILFLLSLIFVYSRNLWIEKKDVLETKNISQKNSVQMVTLNTFLSSSFFFIYTATEGGMGLWSCSMMIEDRGFSTVLAGLMVSSYWGALTVGRIIVGFLTKKYKDKDIILCSIILSLIAVLMVIIPNKVTTILGIILLGLGLSGIYPCTMNETHKRYERETAKILVGHQVGSACLGFAVMTPLIGIIIQKIGLNYLPVIIFIMCIFMLMIEMKLRKLSKNA